MKSEKTCLSLAGMYGGTETYTDAVNKPYKSKVLNNQPH